MSTAYYVKKYRSKADIATAANTARERLGIANFYTFNIVTLFREKLIGKKFPIIGTMKLRLFTDSDDPDGKAYITYQEGFFTLNVHKEIWDLADLCEPESRYILAHELGHIVLHNDYRREFTPITSYQRSFIPDEQHSEWQANAFAACFLAPPQFVRSDTTPQELARQFDFPVAYANDYLTTKLVRKKNHIGEVCPECANFSLVRNGTCFKCDTCGATSGCS